MPTPENDDRDAKAKAFEVRAEENLDAAKALLSKSNDRHAPAAASRNYYALYQRVVSELLRRGERPDKFDSGEEAKKGRWPHSTINSNLGFIFCEHLGLDKRRWCNMYTRLMGRRIAADYRCEPVPHALVKEDREELERMWRELP